jgi:hypothetical protein
MPTTPWKSASTDVIGDGTANSQRVRLGKAVERYALRVFNDWRIVRSSVRAANKGVLWRLRPAAEPVEDAQGNDDDSNVTPF